MQDFQKKYGYLRNKVLGSRVITYVQLALVLTIASIALADSKIILPPTVVPLLYVTTAALMMALAGVTLVRALSKSENSHLITSILLVIATGFITIQGLYLGTLLGQGFNDEVVKYVRPVFFEFVPKYFVLFVLIFVTAFEPAKSTNGERIVPKRFFWALLIFIISAFVNLYVDFYPNVLTRLGISYEDFLAVIFLGTTVLVLFTLLFAKRWRNDSYHHFAVISLILLLFYGSFYYLSTNQGTDIKMVFAMVLFQTVIITMSIGQYAGLYELLIKGEIQKELAIRQSLRLDMFSRATDTAKDMIVISEPDGSVVYANPAITTTTGFTVAEAIGTKAGTLWGKQMSKEFYANLWDTISVKKKPYQGVLKNRRKNGKSYYAALTISPVLDAKGNVKNYAAIERDITEEKLAEKQKYDFLSIISHRLRTPLTTNKWSLEMLSDGEAGKLTKKQKELMADLNSANERLIELVNLMSMITDLESGKISIETEDIDLKQLVTTTVEAYTDEAKKKKLDVKLKTSAKLPTKSSDRKIVTIIVDQLISNAIKYSPKSKEIEIRLTNRNGVILFEVEDHGNGFPEDAKGIIFKSFYLGTDKNRIDESGTGMGLYMTKLLADTIGAKIWFDSKLGLGSTFSVAFPLNSNVAKHEIKELLKEDS